MLHASVSKCGVTNQDVYLQCGRYHRPETEDTQVSIGKGLLVPHNETNASTSRAGVTWIRFVYTLCRISAADSYCRSLLHQ
jgi:hypothetical protein